MTPRAGWKQPESECTRSHFPWQRIDLTFLHLLPSSSNSCERDEAAVGVDPHHRRNRTAAKGSRLRDNTGHWQVITLAA